MSNKIVCAENGNVKMEADTISKNGWIAKNLTSMGNSFCGMIVIVVIIMFSIIACSDKNSSIQEKPVQENIDEILEEVVPKKIVEKWEYMVLDQNFSDWYYKDRHIAELTKKLNNLGAAGWELVSNETCQSDNSKHIYILKRKL